MKQWFDSTASQGAVSTAKSYLRLLGLFCERTEMTPSGLLKLSPQRVVRVFRDYAIRLSDKHGVRPTVVRTKAAVLSWLNFNMQSEKAYALSKSAKVGRGAKIPRRPSPPLPTQAELRMAFAAASPKVRVQMALLAFAGMRIEVLGMREGDDGLRFSDFPEAYFDDNGLLQFHQVPTRINVRAELSKTGAPYFAFLGPEGCAYLQGYVAFRRAAGQQVSKASPVVVPDIVRRRGMTAGNNKEFIHPNNISDAIRHVLRGIGSQIRPYDLRHYYSQNSELAIVQGLNADWKEYWMGHKPGVKQLYSLRDAEQLAEKMRAAYVKTLRYIETTAAGHADRNTPSRMDILRAILEATGRCSAQQLADMDDDEVATQGHLLLRGRRLQPEPARSAAAEALLRPATKAVQRIVTEAELEPLLAEGWVVKIVLSSGKIVATKEP